MTHPTDNTGVPTIDYPTYRELQARTDAPPGSSWNLFGPHDQLGTLNFLQLADLTRSADSVRAGQAFSLDLRSDTIWPSLAPTRQPLDHHIFQRTPFHRDEWLDHFYTQYGSQIDGLRHIAHPDYGFYNGADSAAFTPGTESLSIHHLAQLPIAGRAILIDIDRYIRSQGTPLDHRAGEPVALATITAALDAQGTPVHPGDILLLRFGWLDFYRNHSEREWRENLVHKQFHTGVLQSEDVMEWLWDNRIAMVAADNFAFECWPAQPGTPFLSDAERRGETSDPHAGIMHRALIGLLGMPIGELWDLDALAEACANDRRHDCLITVSPMPLVGGVGSPANATALR
ncbi:cyclase family protein [Rhodococcus sp. WS3]|uniref:cyclase family protein n=1 Tax=unclassified Rhodococcus (in: high G+C Gram-positive bacteria) TaxID=192944 RepID=UPI0005D3D21F|nr:MULTISPECIES: cyclase family protein [unclassified Rhodococcus (in: high G+C Gram-positive bacteria)]KJF19221.1 putative cyclase [Rhodococcus sp. AD45]ROZ42800.1 cyclase family protein [Rhodococcus sp. WS3]RZL20871.1 MAG: cyclase family protein [Rhodococcus sp. (in: high G+C Gram-positive bacteria)]